MSWRAVLILFVCLAFASSGYSQRTYPGESPKSSTGAKPVRPPVTRGSKKAVTRANGVLFVLTKPATSKVIIKSLQGNTIQAGMSQQGEYRIELSPGRYRIEVSADKYSSIFQEAEVKRAEPEYIQVELAPNTGSIQIGMGGIPPDANILIDGQEPKSVVKKPGNQIQINDISVGPHTLRITHPSITPYEEKVEVQGGIPVPVTPMYREANVTFLVKSEPGATIFIDDNLEGRIGERGELRIAEKYKPGRHTIRAEKESFEPEQKSADYGVGEAVVDVKLNRVKTSPEFSDYFQEGAAFWDAPKVWVIERGRMYVRPPDAGFIRDKLYDNFKMVFDISFTNNKGAVWIVRARDKKNYYLFQLTGPTASSPRLFRSYIYKDGQATLLKSDTVVDDLSRPNDQFTITIEAKGSTITHYFQARSAPKAEGAQLLSSVQDSTYSYGAIGFASKDGEEFLVRSVTIIPDESKTR